MIGNDRTMIDRQVLYSVNGCICMVTPIYENWKLLKLEQSEIYSVSLSDFSKNLNFNFPAYHWGSRRNFPKPGNFNNSRIWETLVFIGFSLYHSLYHFLLTFSSIIVTVIVPLFILTVILFIDCHHFIHYISRHIIY
jgi:hypothetical protein